MSEEQQLAVAVARFRPLDGPLPPGFDVETLPVYRAPVSHLNVPAAWTRPAPLAAAPQEAEDDNQDVGAAVAGPVTAQDTPENQTCQWASWTKTFSGFNGPILVWVDSPHLHQPTLLVS